MYLPFLSSIDVFKFQACLKLVAFDQFFGVRKKKKTWHFLTQCCSGTAVTHWKHSSAWVLFKHGLHVVLPVVLWTMSDETFKLREARNGCFRSFHFLANSNLHRMTGGKKEKAPYHETTTRFSPEICISGFTQLQIFTCFLDVFHKRMQPNFTFLNVLLWLIVAPNVIRVCRSLESFSNFHSFIVCLLFQELYFVSTFSVVGIETHTYHWKHWLLLYLLGVYFVGQSVDDVCFCRTVRIWPIVCKSDLKCILTGNWMQTCFWGGIPARSWLWPLMLCSVKDRWEDGMNQYMSTAQMVQSCSIHILISYPSETEINNPFITGNSCQPAERSVCDLGWNCLQGFLAVRKLAWMLVLKSWLRIDRNLSVGIEGPWT